MRITDEQINEIFLKVMSNPAAAPENFATLRFNAESLKENFNAQLSPFLEEKFMGEELSFWKKLLLIGEYKFFPIDELDLFVNNFSDSVGLFGVGVTDGNFKILSLCYTAPKTQRESRTVNFVFNAFSRTFFPALDPNELSVALKKNFACAVGDVIFEMVHSKNLNLLHAVSSIRN